jgi:hypothetical protein
MKKRISQMRTEARLAHLAEMDAPGERDPQTLFRARLASWDAEDRVLDQLIEAGLADDLLEVERLARKAGIQLRTVRRAETWLDRTRQIRARWEAGDLIFDPIIDAGLRRGREEAGRQPTPPHMEFETALKTLAQRVARGELSAEKAREELRAIAAREGQPPESIAPVHVEQASNRTPA